MGWIFKYSLTSPDFLMVTEGRARMKNAGWNFEHSYTELPDVFFQKASPTAVASPKLLVFNASLAKQLGLNSLVLSGPDAAQVFSGNQVPEEAHPIAQAYAGHQFGNFTMLGDGRALLLGEHITPEGNRFDIQFKGSGRTPFSRRGDGRAALGPMLREYIISEAMHALGIPTTRSLAVVSTGEFVLRDRPLPGAVLTRVAASHIRVGTFEYAAARGDAADIAALTLYTLDRHFPNYPEDQPPALTLLRNVIEKQAKLVAKWMQVGFIHGVMNTDNMALSGETIDYGPCAFMDTYNPNTVFSSIDEQGRYAYANQARIALWNLERFAETLLPILSDDEETAVQLAQDAIDSFAEIFNSAWLSGMQGKLGLLGSEEGDQTLITQLLGLMQKAECDYTNTFRSLPLLLESDAPPLAALASLTEFKEWKNSWHARINRQNISRTELVSLMNRNNPSVIPRNHRVEEALKAAELNDDLSVMEKLVKTLQSPFADSADHLEYSKPPEAHERVVATFCGT